MSEVQMPTSEQINTAKESEKGELSDQKIWETAQSMSSVELYQLFCDIKENIKKDTDVEKFIAENWKTLSERLQKYIESEWEKGAPESYKEKILQLLEQLKGKFIKLVTNEKSFQRYRSQSDSERKDTMDAAIKNLQAQSSFFPS